MESTSSVLKPWACRDILQICTESGTIIDMGRNRLFKLSGSSVLPAYPGFIVMNKAQFLLRHISLSSKSKTSFSAAIASRIVFICIASTLRTSISILLNSSKHPQNPVYANPSNRSFIFFTSMPSLQLKTKTNLPIFFPKSLTVSVFPVPAGPWGLPPLLKCKAVVKVKKHLSVSGVITSLPLFP